MLGGRARASASEVGVRVASRECDVIVVIVLIYRSSELVEWYSLWSCVVVVLLLRWLVVAGR
jgi:hypothetical protein